MLKLSQDGTRAVKMESVEVVTHGSNWVTVTTEGGCDVLMFSDESADGAAEGEAGCAEVRAAARAAAHAYFLDLVEEINGEDVWAGPIRVTEEGLAALAGHAPKFSQAFGPGAPTAEPAAAGGAVSGGGDGEGCSHCGDGSGYVIREHTDGYSKTRCPKCNPRRGGAAGGTA